MTDPLTLIRFYLEHGQLERALGAAREAIAKDPEDAHVHALLALILCDLDQSGEALDAAARAVHLDADDPLTHYAFASALLDLGRHDEALSAAQAATRLDPEEPDHHALEARILGAKSAWEQAVTTAQRALAIDPEHATAINVRAHALTQLGRVDEAESLLRTALVRDPEDALSHANLGWRHLHAGQIERATASFQEALRLDPQLEFARTGLVEALKARHRVYAWFLRYSLWMQRQSSGVRWGLILGLYVGVKVLRRVGERVPDVKPWVVPIVIVYMVFVFSSWIADPLFNLLLFLHPLGRHALDARQRRGSALLGVALLAGVVQVGAYALTGNEDWAVTAGGTAFLVLPIGAWNATNAHTRAHTIMSWLLGIGILATVMGSVLMHLTDGTPGEHPLLMIAVFAWAGSIFLSPWIANLSSH